MSKEAKFADLKNRGFLHQKQDDKFSMRIHIIGGRLNVKDIHVLADIAEKYGENFLHITSRQGIEIPFISINNIDAVEKTLLDNEISAGAAGKKFRSIMACHGSELCNSAIVDTQSLAKKIDELYFGSHVPKKFKVAITGCPSSCMKVQDNDFGIMGVVKPKILPEYCIECGLCVKKCPVNAIKLDNIAIIDEDKCVLCGKCVDICNKKAIDVQSAGYTVFVGGKIGRIPRAGTKLEELVSEERVLNLLKNTIEYYNKYAVEGERFGLLLNRIGMEHFKKEVL